jgi:hypothetical protein
MSTINFKSRLPISLEEQRTLSQQYGITFEDFEDYRYNYRKEHGVRFPHNYPSSKLQDWRAEYHYRIGKITEEPKAPGFNHHVNNFVKSDKMISQQRVIAKRHAAQKENKRLEEQIMRLTEKIINLKQQMVCSHYKICTHCKSIYDPNLLQSQSQEYELLQDQNGSSQSLEMISEE